MKEVTDPKLLAQLESGPREVTDPAILAQLEGQTTQRSAVRQVVENIPGSAARFGEAIAQPFLHPVETFQGLQKLTSGAVQMIPGVSEGLDFVRENVPQYPFRIGTREDVDVARNVGRFYADRFGSMKNLRQTAIEDPVGLAADASAIFGLGGMGLRAAGLSRAANIAQTASRAVDPLALTTRATTAVAAPAYRFLVGQTTGTSPRIVRKATEGANEFLKAMRGKTTEGEIVEHAKDALGDIRQARSTEYRARLENLKSSKQQVPIDDIKTLADEQLKRFNVKVTDEGLDFSRSTASGASAKEIDEVYKLVQDWGSQPGDLTPAMLDVLKRRLDDFYAEGRTSRAMVTTLKKAVQDKIVRTVPQYAEMTKDYAKTTELIKEMERAIGLGSKTAADTTIRKLMLALREDKAFRSDLLKMLDEAGESNVTAEIAGASMRPVFSRSLQSLVAGSFGVGGFTGLIGLTSISPTLAALIPLASPRLMGELSVLLGRLKQAAPFGRGTGILAYQAGRLTEQERQ